MRIYCHAGDIASYIGLSTVGVIFILFAIVLMSIFIVKRLRKRRTPLGYQPLLNETSRQVKVNYGSTECKAVAKGYASSLESSGILLIP